MIYPIFQKKLIDVHFADIQSLVDNQIPEWLRGVGISPTLLPKIKDIYEAEIKTNTRENKEDQIERLKTKLAMLENEESRLVRLFMTGKINEGVYDQLRQEWQEKTLNTKAVLKEMEFDAKEYLDNLEVALLLLTNISTLFERFKEKERTELLQVLLRRIIIMPDGEIISYELHSPFSYLISLADRFKDNTSQEGDGSTSVTVSTPTGGLGLIPGE